MPRIKKHRYLWGHPVIVLGAAGALFLGGVIVIWAATLRIPDLQSIKERKLTQTTKIYDRTGDVLLSNWQENERRTSVPLPDISPYLRNATIAIEDEEFYQHHGIKPTAILRAIIANLTTLEYSQGGSTITQQVVKNSLLTKEKTITRKLKEWVLAIKLERVLSKDQILELYLNENPYGGNLYGAEEASLAFFGKKANDVDLAQAAYLAALPQAPTLYSPFGNHRDLLEQRKNLVLSQMQKLGFISQTEMETARAETVEFLRPSDQSLKAPHFVFYIREYLENKYGQRAVEEDGLKVITTLDYSLQNKAEEIVKKHALENQENFNAENAGLVAVDPRTGHILAMVGSRDYFDPDIDGNYNITLARRQPGSAFKPFVYAAAFKKGYTPDTVVFDLKTQFSATCAPTDFSEATPCYSPNNYDGVFHGPVTLRNALAQSMNVPSVKTLYLAGLNDSLQTARDLGISTLSNVSQYGLTLVLGGGEVTLLDMTGAYGAFANDGARNPPVGILRVENAAGEIVEEYTPNTQQVLDQEISRKISDVLSDNAARAPAFGDSSYLYFPGRPVAVKTGTTNDYRDAWIIGYTPSLAVGAWTGNNDNSPMEKKVAGFIVAPLWHEFMETALNNTPVESFPSPEPTPSGIKPILRGIWKGGQTYVVDKFSGALASDQTPPEAREERVVTNVHSILYWLDKDNPRGETPGNPSTDPQFGNWEFPVRQWAASQGLSDQSSGGIPIGPSSSVRGAGPAIEVSGVGSAAVPASSRLSVRITTTGANPLERVDVFINDTLVGSSHASPALISFTPKTVPGIQNTNTLRVVAYDSVYNKSEKTLPFLVDTSR